MRLDQRVLVLHLPGKVKALVRNLERLVLVAAHEVERAQAPQRAKLARCVADLPAQLAGTTERLRSLSAPQPRSGISA